MFPPVCVVRSSIDYSFWVGIEQSLVIPYMNQWGQDSWQAPAAGVTACSGSVFDLRIQLYPVEGKLSVLSVSTTVGF